MNLIRTGAHGQVIFAPRATGPSDKVWDLVACIWFDLGWEAAGNKKGADAPSLF